MESSSPESSRPASSGASSGASSDASSEGASSGASSGTWLADAWAPSGRIRLQGPLEHTSANRRALSFALGFVALGVGFGVFQFLVTPLVFALQLGSQGADLTLLQSQEGIAQIFQQYTQELIVSNSAGQVFGLALVGLVFARLHTTDVRGFLRLRSTSGALLMLGVAGVIGAQPIVQWLASVNQMIPLPEALEQFERTQTELIQRVLESDMGLAFNLAMLALVPGICEEVLFRGYAQRQFERSGSATFGIVLSGVLFGLYHLRPSQLLPLTFLGLYLAYLTWRTGSLIPAMVVHFAHNGLAVFAANFIRTSDEYDMDTLQDGGMPWYGVVIGALLFGGVVYVLQNLAPRVRGDES